MANKLFRIKESITAKLVIAIGILIVSGSIMFWYAILNKQEKFLQLKAKIRAGSHVFSRGASRKTFFCKSSKHKSAVNGG